MVIPADFKMGLHGPDLEIIGNIVGCADEIAKESLKTKLLELHSEYETIKLSQSDGQPSLRQQSETWQQIATAMKKGTAKFDQFYTIEVDGGQGSENGAVYDTTPEWYADLIIKVNELANEIKEVAAGIKTHVKPGKDPDFAFRKFEANLASLYVELTDHSAATNSMGDKFDEKIPTNYQAFVKAVFVGFRLEITESFNDKVHKARITKRNAGR